MKNTWVLLVCLSFSMPVKSQDERFKILDLPSGKDVTLMAPATTLIPLKTRVKLAATNHPQTVKFRPVQSSGSTIPNIRLAIYDSSLDRVLYVELKKDVPFLYNIRDLGSIFVVPEMGNEASSASSSFGIEVESDGPLQLAR
jgi:hypothetical protein